jgi:hypothetical protein
MKPASGIVAVSCILPAGSAFAAGPFGGPFSGGGGGAFGSIVAILGVIVIVFILIIVVPELVRDAGSGNGGPLITYLFWILGIPLAIFYGGYFDLSFWPAVGAGFGSSLVLGALAAMLLERRRRRD